MAPVGREGQKEQQRGGSCCDGLDVTPTRCLRDVPVEVTSTQLGAGICHQRETPRLQPGSGDHSIQGIAEAWGERPEADKGPWG